MRGLILVFLLFLTACASEPEVIMIPVEPVFPAQPSMQASAVTPHIPQFDARRQQAIDLVKAFVNNQNYDGLDGFLVSVRKNRALAAGPMLKLLDLEERIFAEKKKTIDEWHSLYDKGQGVLEQKFVDWADAFMHANIYPRERMSLQMTIKNVEVLNGDDDGIPVKVTYEELANLPEKKHRAVLEDIYIVCNYQGRLSVCDVSMNNQPISDLSLTILADGLERENSRESEYLSEFRKIVGLSS